MKADIECDQLPFKKRGKSRSLFLKLIADGPDGQREVCTGSVLEKGQSSVSWLDTLTFTGTSLELQLYQRHKLPRFEEGSFTLSRDEHLGSAKVTAVDLPKEGSSAALLDIPLHKTTKPGGSDQVATKIKFSITSLPKHAAVAVLQREEAIGMAEHGISGMQAAPLTTNNMEALLHGSAGAADAVTSFADTWSSLLDKIEPFIEITDKLAEVRSLVTPFGPGGTDICQLEDASIREDGMFYINSCTQVIKQRNRDESLCGLMENIRDIHSFLLEAEPLKKIKSHRKTFDTMGGLTVKCAKFIVECTVNEKFWKRALTQSFSGVDEEIAGYNTQFSKLREEFKLHAALHTENAVNDIAIEQALEGMPYAEGARYGSVKPCLSGTRTAILGEVYQWIDLPDDLNPPRILVLTGAAGTGKSAIARTVAEKYDQMKKLGSSIFFEEAYRAQRHSGNLLPTISRDIADLNTQWRHALYEEVHGERALRQTTSIAKQLDKFILKPAQALDVVGPVVIVIDALDEIGGDAEPRRELLQHLAEGAAKLPSNFRILITARHEDEIQDAFVNKIHVELKPLQDHLDDISMDKDIFAFIQSQLADTFGKTTSTNGWCESLTGASGRLFQWAATACLAILHPEFGETQQEIYTDLVNHKLNLDDLYKKILSQVFKVKNKRGVSRFPLVMGNILGVKEPLSMECHDELWRKSDGGDGVVKSVVGPLSSLLSGVRISNVPVRALHKSFVDFLNDRQRSGIYYIDPEQQDRHLAFTCLRVMNTDLKFNICGLESSYKRNVDIIDLPERVKNFISPALYYACRFVGDHMNIVSDDEQIEDFARELPSMMEYNRKLCPELLTLFCGKFPFWLEVLSLMKQMNTAAGSLGTMLKFSKERVQGSEGSELASFVKDAISFINVFAPPISESAPHIYLSALPFAPTSSCISRQYLPQYPSTIVLSSGRLQNWPASLKMMEGHSDSVTAVAYSPDGRQIVSSSYDGTARVWDAETGEIVHGPFEVTSSVRAISYSPCDKHIVVGCDDGGLRILYVETGENIGGTLQGHTDWVRSVAYSPCGKFIASASDDHTIRLWDTVTGICATTLLGHDGWVMAVAYSLDGKHIASGSRDRTVRVWDAETYKTVGVPFEGHTDEVISVTFSPDSRHIVSGSSDKTIRVWDITGQLVAGPFEGHSGGITSVAYSKDGRFIATGSSDKTVRVLDSQTGVTVAGPFGGHSAAVRSVAFSPDGRCVVSGAADNTVRVWDAESLGIAARTVDEGRGGPVLAVACSPDGRHIASGSTDGSIRIWNLETGELVWGPLERHSNTVSSMAYSPDGKHIVSGSYDETIRIWSGETGTIVAGPFQGHGSLVMAVAWSPDGKYIVSGSYDETIRVWNATTGEIALGPLTGHSDSVRSVAYSANGQYLVSGSDDETIRLWNTETGEMVGAPFEGHTSYVLSVAFSPDGQRVASGSADKTIRVWDIKTGQIVAGPFEGHSRQVNSVVYSPDGKYITSCSNDKTIRMWDVETGETIAGPFTAHSGEVNSVAYTRDGKYFVSSSEDGTIRVWRIEQALARANLSRSDNEPADFRDDCPMEKGWVSTASGDLLFWVPSWHREGLLWPSNTAVTASNLTRLDLSRFVHGFRWQECRESEMA
ncbi:hypothetical protein HWV62_11870 [Athelia sp. TMB]|nr:hypothetical protein HWV62_11870 [Athelia sp. TMB]